MTAAARAARTLGWFFLERATGFIQKLKLSNADPDRHRRILRSLEPGVYALYVHMPFCHTPLCKFCCFVRYPYTRQAEQLYIRSLRRETENLAATAEAADIRIVYIGGGTPTINIHDLVEYIDLLRSLYGHDIVVSTESSPLDINEESVKLLRQAGVTRLSIGVQALGDKRLREMGRLSHTVADSLRAVEEARGRFKTLNIDMVWGIPSDTPRRVKEEALKALSLGADQVTFYPLMPAPGIRRLLRSSLGGPWHPAEHDMYNEILNAATEKDYRPATPWCMNKEAKLIDEYVVEYDRFLALGLSGIARAGGYMYVNTFTPSNYARLVTKHGFAARLAVKPSPEEDVLYHALTMLFGLEWCPRTLVERYGPAASHLASYVSASLRLLGEKPGPDGCTRISRRETLYALHVAQRSLYMALNELREWGMSRAV